MSKRVRKQAHENLDDITLSRVISLLNKKPAITKKAACEILNIRYSTKRLADIITEYEDRKEYEKKARAKNKGKPLTEGEYKYIILNYLKGESMSGVADSLYRSASTVKSALVKHSIPLRTTEVDYFNPSVIPEDAISEDFDIGELVWSARYNCVAEIMDRYPEYYRIWVYGKHNQFSHQPWFELGKLPILKQFNIQRTDIEMTQEI